MKRLRQSLIRLWVWAIYAAFFLLVAWFLFGMVGWLLGYGDAE